MKNVSRNYAKYVCAFKIKLKQKLVIFYNQIMYVNFSAPHSYISVYVSIHTLYGDKTLRRCTAGSRIRRAPLKSMELVASVRMFLSSKFSFLGLDDCGKSGVLKGFMYQVFENAYRI